MNASLTRWLLLLALALGVFIILVERRTESTGERLDRSTLLWPGADPAQATSLSLVASTNFSLRLERMGDQWVFRAPFPYPARTPAVEECLTRLAELRWRNRLEAAEVVAQTNGLRAFGFEPPAAVLTIQQGARRFELRLGGPTLLGGQVYAQVVGQDGLFTVDGAILPSLPVSLNAWRDTGLVHLPGRKADRIEVRPITNGFEVVRDPTNRVWQLTKPLPLRADHAKVEVLLQQLELAPVMDFVVDDPRVDLEPYGLQPPQRELVLGRGTNDLMVLQIGHSPTNAPDQLYVRRGSHSNVVLVARTVLAPWLTSFREFCDRHVMTFSLSRVDRLEARAQEAFALERGTNEQWRIVAPFTAPADTVLVLEWLQELAKLEFLEFEREVATDFAAYGLQPPLRQYVVLTASTNAATGRTNEVLAQLDLGAATGHKFFARRSLENAVVTLVDNGRLPGAAYAVRDRRLWNFTTNQIQSLTVQQLGQTRKLLRTGPMQWILSPGSPGRINGVTLEEAAYRLGQLRAERWLGRGEDDLTRYGFGTTDHRVTLTLSEGSTTRDYVVRFGRALPSGRSGAAAVQLEGEAGWVIFECPRSLYEFVQSDLTVPADGTP